MSRSSEVGFLCSFNLQLENKNIKKAENPITAGGMRKKTFRNRTRSVCES